MLKRHQSHARAHGKKTSVKRAKGYLNFFCSTNGKIILVLAALLLAAYLVFFFSPRPAVSPAPVAPQEAVQQARLVNQALNAQIPFVENRGQTDQEVAYYAKLQGGNFFFDHQGRLTYQLFEYPNVGSARPSRREKMGGRLNGEDQPAGIAARSHVLRETFQTDHLITATPLEPGQATVNYFLGNDESKWQSNLSTYNLLDLGEVYAGVKVHLKAHLGTIEKIFLVQPGTDPSAIILGLEGADGLRVNEQGELEMVTSLGLLKFTKPVAWQEIDGQRRDVEAAYRLIGGGTYGFTVGTYDPAYELIIDPLLSASYLGGDDWEGLREILGGNNAMVVANGSLYVTAYTYSTDFPTTTGAYDETTTGDGDVFISKISLDLGTLQASTFLGGSTNDDSESVITADTSGNIIVAGNTDATDFPGTTGKYQPALSGGSKQDGFVAKLDGNLSNLLAATYIGGTGYDWMDGLVYDPTGYIYVGLDADPGFPTTPINASEGYDTSYEGSFSNIAVVRFDEDLSADYYTMTYIGGDGYYPALARDADGKIFVTGGCVEDVPIVRANAFIPSYQETPGSSCDTFVARFSADLTSLEVSTLIGSAYWENDFTETIAIHGSGANEQIFVIGDSRDGGDIGGFEEFFNNNPHTLDLNPNLDERIYTYGPLSTDGTDDIYILRFNRDLQTAAATVIGGSDQDPCPFLALNDSGEVYFTASTYSDDFPTTSGAFATSGSIVMGKFSNDLTQLLGSSYLGTYNDWENYSHIIVDDTSGYDIAYLFGETSSTDLPGTSGGFQPTSTGGDLYIAAFSGDFATVSAPTELIATPGDSEEVDLSWTAPAGQVVPIIDYEIHFSEDGFDTDDQTFSDGIGTSTTDTVTGLTNGLEYSFRVYAIDDNDDYSPASNTATATPAGPEAPDAITDLSALPGIATAYLDWSEPEDYGNPITSYIVRYSDDGFVSDDQLCETASCTDATPGADVTGLVNGTEYSFRVYAVNVNGTSPVSNTATATPQANSVVGTVEVHVSEVNAYLVFSPNVYNAVSSGISDNELGSQDFNAFASPRNDNYTGLIPPLSRAVRYLFYTDGAVVEHDGITYSAEDMSGATTVTLPDDGLTTSISLPFAANLYGEQVDTIRISSNGFIYAADGAVSATSSGCCGGQNLTNLSGTGLVGNDIIIAGTWTDLYPPGAGSIKYKTVGSSPNRIFVIEFNDVSPCCDATGGNSFQIKIFEAGQTMAAPTVTSVTPDIGLAAGGSNVIVSGSGFLAGASLTFDGTPATNVVVVNSSTITATTPAGAVGLADVTVTNSDTQSGTLTGGYEYTANPPPNLNYCAGYQDIAGSYNPQTIALAADGTVWWWGILSGRTNLGPIPAPAVGLDNVSTVSQSDNDTGYALKNDGTVWAWGEGEYGQLGNGTYLPSDTPVQVSGLSGVEDIAAGYLYGIALKNDGTVWSWGYNGYGALGDGTFDDSNVPVQVLGLSGIEAIYVEESHNLALKDDGSLWFWGDNGEETAETPYEIMPAASGISKVAMTGWHALVLKTDGSVWAWGSNWSGQLGNGSDIGTATPFQLAGEGVADVFANYEKSFVVLDNGDFYAWGENSQGQLGIGTYSDQFQPQLLETLSGEVTAVYGDQDNTYFLLDDSTLWSTGNNEYGQLGDGGWDGRPLPIQIEDLSGVITVGVASDYAHALLDDGTLWGFGRNEEGQLGDGSIISSNVPVQTISPCFNISPDHGPYTGGTVVTLTGSGFLPGATVTFDGLPATGVTVDSATQITATTPAHAVGAVDVVVTNTDNQSSSYLDGFTYTELAPTVSTVVPDSGSSHQYTPVTISGSNFQSGASVTFDGYPAGNVVVENSTTITADAPPHAAGLVDVTVTNPDEQSDTLADAFTYAGTADLQITDLMDSDQSNPTVITTSDGHYLIAWRDERNSGVSGRDIYAQKIDSTTGDILWTSYLDGREITGAPNFQPYTMSFLKAVADDEGGAFLLWDTNTTFSNYDIYVHHIDSSGAGYPSWTSGGYPGVNVSGANTYRDTYPDILYDGAGGVYVSWTAYLGSWPNYDVIVTHLDGDTALPTGDWPVTIDNDDYDDGANLVLGEDASLYVITDTYPEEQFVAQKYDSDGFLLEPFDPLWLDSQEPLNNDDHIAVSDGAGGFKLAYNYQYYDDILEQYQHGIRVIHVDGEGTVLLDDILVEAPGTEGDRTVQSLNALNDAEHGLYLVYTYDAEVGAGQIFARTVSTEGVVSERLALSGLYSYLPYGYEQKLFLAPDGYGGIMVGYLYDIQDLVNYVGLAQLDANLEVTRWGYGLGLNSVGYPTLTMDGTVGAISWHGYEDEDGAGNIYAALISSREPDDRPTVESIVPDSGPLEGGTSLSITGTNFEDGNTSVSFFENSYTFREACLNIVVNSPTSLTCTTPPGPAATAVDVVIATSEGSGELTDGFTYTSPYNDTIEIHTAIPAEPDNFAAGISNGDDAGALADINFTGAPTSAGLDGAEAYSFVVGVPTRSIITQYLESRSWTNVLENLGGGLMANEDDKYSVDIPLGFTATIYGRSVDTVRVTSNGFIYLNLSTNTFGTDTAPGVGYSMTDYANLPDGVNGSATGDILVAAAWGDLDATKTGDDAIRYYSEPDNEYFILEYYNLEHETGSGDIRAQIKIKGNGYIGDTLIPEIGSVNPSQGPLSGLNSVTINGNNFHVETPDVTFGGRDCTNIVVLNATTLTCNVPAGAALGFVDVTVATTAGSDTLTNGYRYFPGIGEAKWPSVASPSPVIVDDGVGWSWDGRIVRTSDGNFVTVIEGNADSLLNAQKINPAGQKLWNGGDPVVVTNSNASGVYDVLPDASGGVFIAHSGNTVSNHNDYVSRIDSNGNVLWTAGPFETNASFYDLYPRVTSDGNNGVYVTWSTYDWASSPEEVRLTHLGSDGAVCELANCGVTWNSAGSGTYRPLTLPVGTITANDEYLYPLPTPSDSGSIIVTYHADASPEEYYIVKINPDGGNDWGPAGTYLSFSDSEILSNRGDDFQAEPDGSGGVFIAYGADDGVDSTVRIVRIDQDGDFVLGSASGGLVTDTVVPDGGWSGSLHSVSENDGNLYLLWNNYPPRVQKYDGTGAELWTTGGVSITQNEDSNLEDYVETDYRYNTYYTTPIAPDGHGGLVVVGRRDSLVYGDYITVFAQRVTSDGDLDWGNSFSVNKFPYYDGAWGDYNENVVSDGNGGAVILWNRYDHYGEEVDPEDYYSAVQYVKAGILGSPEIYDINPEEGPSTGGTNVIIRGQNFTDGATVSFDGTPATYAVTASSNVIVATTPAHAPGWVDVQVTTTAGNRVYSDGFYYTGPAPTVTDATPDRGTIAGGTIVTLTGIGFQTGASVTFDGYDATGVIVLSATELTAVTPPHGEDLVDITVTNPDLQAGDLVEGFEYIADPPPSLHHCVDYTAIGIGRDTTQGMLNTPDGSVWNSGRNDSYQLGDGTNISRSSPVQAVGLTGNFTKFASGADYTLGLRDDGTVWAWGSNPYGQLGDGTFSTRTTPVQVVGLSSITDIKAGYWHNIALKSDGTVWTWGYNGYGQIGDSSYNNRSTPAAVSGVTTATAIAATTYTSHYVLANGTAWGMGYNYYGTLGDYSYTNRNYPVQAYNLTGVDALSSGYQSFMVAHKTDGTVWAWGQNGSGQLGIGYTSTRLYYPAQVHGLYNSGTLTNVASVYSEGNTAYAIINDGTVVAWGYGGDGELGNYSTSNYSYPVQVAGLTSPVETMDMSNGHVLALQNDGTIMGWGLNSYGQLGSGDTIYQRTYAAPVTGLGGVIDVYARESTSIALKNDGTIWTWGLNSYGQLGNGSANYNDNPTPVQPLSYCDLGISPDSGPTEGGTEVTLYGANFVDGATVTFDNVPATAVVFVDEHTLTATTPAGTYGPADVKVTNPDGQFDTLTAGFTYTSNLPFIYDVTPDSGRSVGGTAVTITGDNFIGGSYEVEFGGNPCTDLVVEDSQTLTCVTPASTPAYTEGPVDVTITTIYGTDTLVDGFTYTSSVPTITDIFPISGPTTGGASVLITGTELVDDNLTVTFDTAACTDVTPNPEGTSLTCTTGAHAIGTVDVTVSTDHGTDTLTDAYTYTTPSAPDLQACTGFVDIESGEEYTVALASNGTVWAWGNNVYGSLGDGSFEDSNIPVQVRGLSGIVSIGSGLGHVVALKNDGTVWTWGLNADGQLGNGSFTNSGTPVLVNGLSNVEQIITESSSVFAIRSDGTVWAWGNNSHYVLGNGSEDDIAVPVQVTGLTGIDSVVTNGQHAFAIGDAGTVWAWGRNDSGQLGLGSIGDEYEPVAINGLSGLGMIKTGWAHTLALKNDGTVLAWGNNDQGQVGDGSGRTVTSPVQILTGIQSIEAGPATSFAVKNDGTVLAWGDNWAGQLGDGTYDLKQTPTAVLKLSGITVLEASWDEFTLARKNDGTVWAWGHNEDGGVGDGTMENRNAPAQVGAPLTGISKLETRYQHALVLRSDGSVWGWGFNEAGQLGDGTFEEYRLTPVQTSAISCASVTPDIGSYLGGTNVTITGTNFLAGATVTFDGVPATGVTVVNANEITAITPAHAAEVVDVVVTNPDLQTDTMIDGFTYTDEPTVETVVSDNGPSAGGTSVTITGINYLPGSTVTFDGIPATDVIVVDPTEITCVTPAHPLGAVDVTVTTTNGSGTLTDGFTYATAADLPGEWANAGTPIDGTPDPDEIEQFFPFAITASDGNFITAWTRQGLDSDYDISVQRISRSNGTRLWPDDGLGSGGKRITDLGSNTVGQGFDNDSPNPLVADGSGGAYLLWLEYDIWTARALKLQRIGSDGSLLYGNEARTLSLTGPSLEISDYHMIADGQGGVYVAWTEYDSDSEETQVKLKRVTSSGTEISADSSAFPVNSSNPRLGLDSENYVYVAYMVEEGFGVNYYFRRIAPDGSIPALGQDWFNPFLLPTVTDEEIIEYVLAVDSSDNIIVVYSSGTGRGAINISTQKIDAEGIDSSWFTPGVGGLRLSALLEGEYPLFLQALIDEDDNVLASWHQEESYLVYLQKVDSDGNLPWGISPLQVSEESSSFENSASLVSDGFGGAIVVFRNYDSNGIHLQKISGAGNLLWPNGSPDLNGFSEFSDYTSGEDRSPVLAGDGQGGAAVFWIGEDDTSGYYDVYGQYYRETTIPTITSITPTFGPTTGGTPVTISGTNFVGPGIVVWFGTSQCLNTTVVNSTTITCETPAHPAGDVDVTVVAENGSDTLVAGYTYSDEILCFSDGVNTFCGSQYVDDVGCVAPTTTFTAGPDDFRFGSGGSRSVSSVNDTAYAEGTNGAYFDQTTEDDFVDPNDTLTINSNTPFECGREEAGVTLSISATPFKNLGNQDLVTYGADNALGGTDANADYYGMLSVVTSTPATCESPCVPAQGNVESANGIKAGQNNFFANPGPNNGTPAVGFDDTAVLIDAANQTNEVILYDSSMGFNGDVTVPGLDFVLAVPANIQYTGSFSSTVTYTIS